LKVARLRGKLDFVAVSEPVLELRATFVMKIYGLRAPNSTRRKKNNTTAGAFTHLSLSSFFVSAVGAAGWLMQTYFLIDLVKGALYHIKTAEWCVLFNFYNQ
jgi:hypothetical protein